MSKSCHQFWSSLRERRTRRFGCLGPQQNHSCSHQLIRIFKLWIGKNKISPGLFIELRYTHCNIPLLWDVMAYYFSGKVKGIRDIIFVMGPSSWRSIIYMNDDIRTFFFFYIHHMLYLIFHVVQWRFKSYTKDKMNIYKHNHKIYKGDDKFKFKNGTKERKVIINIKISKYWAK